MKKIILIAAWISLLSIPVFAGGARPQRLDQCIKSRDAECLAQYPPVKDDVEQNRKNLEARIKCLSTVFPECCKSTGSFCYGVS